MRVKLAGLAPMIFAMGLAGSAPAQTERETGSNMAQAAQAEIPDTRHMTSAEKARVTIFTFARCMAQRHRPAVEKGLSVSAWDPSAHAVFMTLINDADCLRYGELKMNQSLLRGGLYAALYRIDFARRPGAIPQTPIDWVRDNPQASPAEQQQYAALRQFADCAVRADAADARTAVLSAPVSVAERDAYARLAPHLNGCTVAGQSLTFSKTVLSGLLAEVLYRNGKATG